MDMPVKPVNKQATNNAEHVTSYYAASAHVQPVRPSLVGDLSFDICVVGAGFSLSLIHI